MEFYIEEIKYDHVPFNHTASVVGLLDFKRSFASIDSLVFQSLEEDGSDLHNVVRSNV
jgi:hypothetical protein